VLFNNNKMDKLWVSIMYLGFFGVIVFAVYYTNSDTPLWALLLFPTVKLNKKSKSKKNKSDGNNADTSE